MGKIEFSIIVVGITRYPHAHTKNLDFYMTQNVSKT
jgi:hypothetical protein